MSIKKNVLLIFVIVMMVLAMVGCAGGKDSNRASDKVVDVTGIIEQEIADVDGVVDTETASEKVGLNWNVGQSTVDVVEAITDNSTSTEISAEKPVAEGNDSEGVAENAEGASVITTEAPADAPVETTAPTGSAQQTEDTEPSTEVSQSTEPQPAESESSEPELVQPATPEPIIYDPYQVVNLVIAKCQAGGMITTEDNLANLLAEGKITQAEYDEYYPLDGLEGSYYSVFVETDLNIASDIVGNKLGSVDGIADYIAGMLLLETHPIFNVTYAGIYTHNGVDFYEFRCHR